MSEETLRERAYRHIQRKLLEGQLRAGSLLSEQQLAAEIGISRTPVREAIGQLQAEGVLDKKPRFGTIVRSPDRRELSEIYELREALESHAASEAARRIAPADRDLLSHFCRQMEMVAEELYAGPQRQLDERGLPRFLNADIGFHMILVRSTGNRRCMKIISEFRLIQRIFEFHGVVYDPQLVGEASEQHRSILRAIEQGDSEAARLLTAAHIRSSKDHALQVFDQSVTEAAAARNVLELPADLLLDLDLWNVADLVPAAAAPLSGLSR